LISSLIYNKDRRIILIVNIILKGREYMQILKNNKGSVLIIYMVFTSLFLCFCAIVTDIGMVIIEKQKLQNAIDAASLAAAQELPNTTRATEVANEYIRLNGCDTADTSIAFSDSNKTISVTATKSVDFYFARYMGFESTTVSPTAKASKFTIGDAFNYVLFSGSKTTTLTLNGSNQYVGGSSHTNKNFVANGSKITITGACEALTTITVNGSQIDINTRIPNAPYVAMPDF